MALPLKPGVRNFVVPRSTAVSGTAFHQHVPPVDGESTVKVNAASYTQANATTGSHALTFMGCMGKTSVAVAAAAGAATLTLMRDPGNYSGNAPTGLTPSVANNNMASGDFFAVLLPDSLWQKNTCGTNATLNANGTLTIDIGTVVPTGGIAAGATVEFYGVPGDTNPNTGRVHTQYLPTANATLSLGNNRAPVAQGALPGTGMVIHSNNTNAAGVLDFCNGWFGN